LVKFEKLGAGKKFLVGKEIYRGKNLQQRR